MNLALEKVNYLKGVIARSCRIPHEKQVLLISGGESLDSEERYVILKRIIQSNLGIAIRMVIEKIFSNARCSLTGSFDQSINCILSLAQDPQSAFLDGNNAYLMGRIKKKCFFFAIKIHDVWFQKVLMKFRVLFSVTSRNIRFFLKVPVFANFSNFVVINTTFQPSPRLAKVPFLNSRCW